MKLKLTDIHIDGGTQPLGDLFSFNPTSAKNTGLIVVGNIHDNPELLETEVS